MDIPPHLIDRTTIVKNHTVWTHLGCVALRCSLGVYLLSTGVATAPRRWAWTALAAAVVAFFLYKFWTVRPTWKVYLRTVVVYTVLAVILHVLPPPLAAQTGGVLLIVDALLGLQSRHTATLLSRAY